MVRIRNIIPESILNYVRLVRLKNKYSGCNIRTYKISNEAIIGNNCSFSENSDVRSGVVIGDYTYLSQGAIIASGKVGKFCSIGYNCQIGMFEHPTNYISTSPYLYRGDNIFGVKQYFDEITAPPQIGNDVWIGSNAIIMQGVAIGNGAIIGAGAVVTKDVEPYSIVGGVPAKFIRWRFDKKKINYLNDLKWWDKDMKTLVSLKDIFVNGENWHEYCLQKQSD